MAYIAAADLREVTRKPWAHDIVLSELSDPDLETLITQVTAQIEVELHDDFEPPSPDNDEVLLVDGPGTTRLYVPRRVRSLTTVEVMTSLNIYSVQGSTTYLHRRSLNGAGTAMVDDRRQDWLDAQAGLTTVGWPAGASTVRLTGKFGWAAVPDDIKRLVALRVYDRVKASSDPLTTILQRTTADAIVTFGESREMSEIVAKYQRNRILVG